MVIILATLGEPTDAYASVAACSVDVWSPLEALSQSRDPPETSRPDQS